MGVSYMFSEVHKLKNKKPVEVKKPDFSRMNYEGTEQPIRRGDIVWIYMEETYMGSEITGHDKKSLVRPAVILQNEVGNMFSPTTIVAYITSSKRKLYPTHVLLKGEQYGLHENSVITLEQIKTVQKQRIIRYLSHLNPEDMKQVDEKLKVSLGL